MWPEIGQEHHKFKEAGLTPVPSKRISSPKIEECLINMECKKLESFEKGTTPGTW